MSGKILKKMVKCAWSCPSCLSTGFGSYLWFIRASDPYSTVGFKWRKAQLESQQNIEKAYADLKAELIEQARIRRQLALEKALADKRAKEAAYAAELQADEVRKFSEQTEALQALRSHLEQEVAEHTARYQKTLKRQQLTILLVQNLALLTIKSYLSLKVYAFA